MWRSSQIKMKESSSCNSTSRLFMPSSLKKLLIKTNLLESSKSSRILSRNLDFPAPGFPITSSLFLVFSASRTSFISSLSTYSICGFPARISLLNSFKSEVIKNCRDFASFSLLISSAISSKYLSTLFTASFVTIPWLANFPSSITTNSLKVPSFLVASLQNNS